MALLVPLAAFGQDLRSRVTASLAEGLGAEALRVIANILEHEGRPPPRTPVAVLDVLGDPLAGTSARVLFERSVPADVRELTRIGSGGAGGPFFALVDRYIGELAQAQAELMAAAAPFDASAISFKEGVPLQRLAELQGAVDLQSLERSRVIFLGATARFAAALRVPGMQFPPPQRFDSAIGAVIIGSAGPDRHPSDAALIIDPGGDDLYERAPATGGALAVVVDLAGNDRYEGSDIALHALCAIIDVSGDDRYSAPGPGLAAAVAGVSVLVDLDGDDRYEADVFGQGAALFGWAALIDAGGDDRYGVKAFGQGYAGTAGVGLLWDLAGNDAYAGDGLPDPFAREGRIGFTQGAASGARGELGGGAGILRDDAGDDRYEGQMFAQGTGYYYALGMLWDRAGHDAYQAVRYAQGTGVHQAAGLLYDEGGDDRYSLSVGVGQGMGLDLAVGVLVDLAGDDAYRSVHLSQATGTANGFGLIADEAGENTFEVGPEARAWGRAQWSRGLPTVAVLLHDPARSRFTRAVDPRPEHAMKHEAEPPVNCAEHAGAVRRVLDDPAANLGDEALPCALASASDAEKSRIWTAMDVALGLPGTPYLRNIARTAREHAGPPEFMQRLAATLKTHFSCAPRAFWAATWASAEEALAALESPCWRLQAAALARLRALGVAPPPRDSTPAFLRVD